MSHEHVTSKALSASWGVTSEWYNQHDEHCWPVTCAEGERDGFPISLSRLTAYSPELWQSLYDSINAVLGAPPNLAFPMGYLIHVCG